MRTCIILCGLAGLLTAASCARHDPHVPDPPVPAVLTEYEAFDLAHRYVEERQYGWDQLRRRELRDWGYMFFFQSPAGWDEIPPKTSHIVAVRHDGTIREWLSDEDGDAETRQAD